METQLILGFAYGLIIITIISGIIILAKNTKKDKQIHFLQPTKADISNQLFYAWERLQEAQILIKKIPQTLLIKQMEIDIENCSETCQELIQMLETKIKAK